ncbi:hypothetical protein SDC9_194717 [bioreactor metagenome]|uniref:Uncharacterized protein n=1 Tax=bioreactor metagenome TaxID=1076179 RepID=A0A645I706_9ZZZZ
MIVPFHNRFHEFVGHAAFVGGPDGRKGIVKTFALSEGNCVVGPFDPVIPLVAVHGIIAARNAHDLAGLVFFQLLFQLFYIAFSRFGRGIPPVEHRVDTDFF